MKTIDELFQEKKEAIKKLQEMWISNAKKLDEIGGLENLTKETIDELIKFEIQTENYFNIYVTIRDDIYQEVSMVTDSMKDTISVVDKIMKIIREG